MEKGSLSAALWMLTMPLKARAQNPCCQPGPPPVPAVYIPPEYEYVRRGDIFVPIFAQIVVGTANSDEDWCPEGNHPEAYDMWYVVKWDDHGAGGEFGYFDGGGRWVVHNGDRTTHYRISRGGEPIEPKVVRISVIVDDYALYADDPPQSSSAWGFDGYFTVWEFWITDGAHRWVPALDSELTFTAWIEPFVDHKGQSMARPIVFLLSSSAEPGYCMNATRISGRWDDTVGSDLKFIPFQQGVVFYGDNAVRTQGSVINFTVRIICLDYGAHSGSLMAYAPIAGENEPARLYRDGNWVGQKDYAPIPWDENNNFISDFSSYNVYHKGWYDSETSPIGDGTFGDGFSVYEEYRGVEVDGPTISGWIRLDPEKKEMFVWLNPNQFNSAEFFPGSGMPVVYLLDSRPGKNRVDPNQRVNYNVDDNSPTVNERHRRDAYAAWLIDGGFDPKAAGRTTGPIWSYNWLYKPRCYIFTQTIALYQGDPETNPLGHTFDEAVKFVVGHELGHTVLWHQWDRGHHDPGNPDHDELCLMWPWIPWHLGHYSSVCFLPPEFCETAPNPRCQFRWKLVE